MYTDEHDFTTVSVKNRKDTKSPKQRGYCNHCEKEVTNKKLFCNNRCSALFKTGK